CQRTRDPVRESVAHARLRRYAARGSLAPDRGARRTRDPGALRLLSPLARRRRADVGRARHHAPRRRRLSAGRAPDHAAHDRVSELRTLPMTFKMAVGCLIALVLVVGAGGCGSMQGSSASSALLDQLGGSGQLKALSDAFVNNAASDPRSSKLLSGANL